MRNLGEMQDAPQSTRKNLSGVRVWQPEIDLLHKKLVWVIIGVLAIAMMASVAYLFLRPPQPQPMRHPLTGYVLEVTPEMNRITVRNADIPGVMSSMVMDYRVKDRASLAGIKPGDTIQAEMATDAGGYWLDDIRVTRKP
jgi:Cu/Ag efflux protein CusF